MIFDTYPWFVNRSISVLFSESRASGTEVLAERASHIETHFTSYVSGASVLDIGCSDGRWTAWALNAGATSVKGIDIREDSITTANATFAEHHSSEAEAPLTGYSFEKSGFADIPDSDNYDCVMLFGCLYVEAIDKAAAITNTVLFETTDPIYVGDAYYNKADFVGRFEANGFTITDHSDGYRLVLVAQKE